MKFELKPDLPQGWKKALGNIFEEAFFKELNLFLEKEYRAGKIIYPARENIFRALTALDLPKVKVVILGQDPYHGPDQAIGFSFAVPNELKKKPPSLKNIFKEIESDLKVELPKMQSDLTGWVGQGVLLLNRVLTVEAAKPLSHRDQGWEEFTARIIECLNARKEPLVFLLWGSHAQSIKEKIDLSRHKIIESVHPSPLSAHRGFLGSKMFSKTNLLLQKIGVKPIDWQKISIS